MTGENENELVPYQIAVLYILYCEYPELIQFPLDAAGNPTTFLLGNQPYMEVSAGVENIFKVLNMSFVKRLNYLDNPNIPALFGIKGLGLRFLISVEF